MEKETKTEVEKQSSNSPKFKMANEDGIVGLIFGFALYCTVYYDGIPVFYDGGFTNSKGLFIVGGLTIAAFIFSIKGIIKRSEHYQKQIAVMAIVLNSILMLMFLFSLLTSFTDFTDGSVGRGRLN